VEGKRKERRESAATHGHLASKLTIGVVFLLPSSYAPDLIKNSKNIANEILKI
jgi:hypothetical protein